MRCRSQEIIVQNLIGNPATSRLQLIHFPSALGFDEGHRDQFRTNDSVVPSGQPGGTVAAFLIAPLTVPVVFSAANPQATKIAGEGLLAAVETFG